MGIVHAEREGPLGILTIDNVPKRNAMTRAMRQQVWDEMAAFAVDEQTRVIVLTGAGEDFCAGADLGATIGAWTRSPERGAAEAVPNPTERHFSQVYKPIVAAVEGYCLGAGTEMLLGTDIRIAGASARFGLPEVRCGIVPLAGSHIRLPREIPYAAAMEMLLVGDPVNADRALAWGLLNHVVADGEALTRAKELALRMCNNSPRAMERAKECLVRGLQLEEPFIVDFHIGKAAFADADAAEGPAAFLDKRVPSYAWNPGSSPEGR